MQINGHFLRTIKFHLRLARRNNQEPFENVGKYTKNTTKDPNSIRPWMKFNYSLNRKHDGRSLSWFLSLGDRLKASWEMIWPER